MGAVYTLWENKMKKFYDYEAIAECAYPLAEHDCGEPAIYRVIIYEKDSTWMKVILVCEKHFYEVIEGLEEI